MEISKDNILATIQKLLAAGKILPQKDRIKFASNPAMEQQKVISETVLLWWDLYKKQHIGVERWELATEKALTISGVNKLEIQIINPALMTYALQKVEEEHLAEQQTRHEQEKKSNASLGTTHFPELGKIIAWHMAHHKPPHFNLPTPDNVRQRLSRGRYTEDYIRKNMVPLQIFFCFSDYAKRDGAEMPLELHLDDEGYLHMRIVA